MSDISPALRNDVTRRAGDRCEYCKLAQIGQEARFHIDHVQPRVSNGPTTVNNLALACVSCSLRKAARISVIDPDSKNETPLFNPRTQSWTQHFQWKDEILHALTPIGRATITALAMNRPLILSIRKEEILKGRHPA